MKFHDKNYTNLQIALFLLTDFDCLKISLGLIAIFIILIVLDQLTIAFLVGLLCLASISQGIANLAYRYMSLQNPAEFAAEEMKELPAILAYYQSTHRKSLGWSKFYCSFFLDIIFISQN